MRIKKLFKSFTIMFIIIFLIIVIATNSRHMWKLFGYSLCENVENVEIYKIVEDNVKQEILVSGNGVGARGYFSSFSYNIEEDTLYIGLKYNQFFGYDKKTKQFDIRVPCRVSKIKHIYLVDGEAEIKIK